MLGFVEFHQDGRVRAGSITLGPRAVAGFLLATVFVCAFAVRWFHRADRDPDFDQIMPYQSFIAHRRAIRILDGGGVLFWEDTKPELIKQIRRPPGYSAFLAGVYIITGPDLRRAQAVQILLDALASTGLAALGFWLFTRGAGLAAGLFYAFSPHLAIYSTIVTPDAVASWPILAAGILFIASIRHPGRAAWVFAASAGVASGASCWLTAQGLTLPLALTAVAIVTAGAGNRRRAAALGLVLIAASFVAVAPLTVRNVSVYGALTPIRPGLGTTLVEGLGVYDPAFPATDGALLADEARRFERPDYEKALYQPDGLLRERDRVRRALAAIASRPSRFFGMMLDRMTLMVTYDTSGPPGWPRDTAIARPVATGAGGISRPARALVHAFQWLCFRSWLVHGLILSGIVALAVTKRLGEGLLVAAIPIHHILLQSLLLTEYKYTLPIHPWLFLLAGIGLVAIVDAFAVRFARPGNSSET